MKSFYSKRVIKLLLYDKQRGKCKDCKEPFAIQKLEMDHIIPRTGGGSDIPSNFQLLCKPCNIRKHAHIPHGTQYGLFDSPRERSPRRQRLTSEAPKGRTEKPMTAADRKRKQRAAAIADGKCSRCLKRKSRPGKSKCAKCAKETKADTYMHREAQH